ncbi:MAG: hypothetical protein H7X77_04220 [Anaerolineae bacterium]|nr:hypothetical protein [Anaerolineae bacterium]
MLLEDIVREATALSPIERRELIKILVDTLAEPNTLTKRRSILEFEGVGAEMWADIDAQEYVNQLRAEW